MTQSNCVESFLSIVRVGIGKASPELTLNADWQAIKALADKQGLTAVIIDGIGKLPDTKRPPKELLLQWIGEVFQNYENRYKSYQRSIAELAGWYNSHGYKIMVLKGYACSLSWPSPSHRPCGDIDIWLFGKQKESDTSLVKEKGVKIDTSHHHHTVFYWGDFMVENHYDFVNVHHHRSNVELEKVFKELGSNDKYWTEVNGERVYLPSPDLHSLFLIKHLASHFASEEVTLRQLLDWAFFVQRNGKDVNWNWLVALLKEYNMIEFFNCINAICVEELGFDSNIFPYVQFNPRLRERVLKEIISPEFSVQRPNSFFMRIPFRYRRWKANEWKHQLCYKDSMWSAFWSGVWNHLLKPSSI